MVANLLIIIILQEYCPNNGWNKRWFGRYIYRYKVKIQVLWMSFMILNFIKNLLCKLSEYYSEQNSLMNYKWNGTYW